MKRRSSILLAMLLLTACGGSGSPGSLPGPASSRGEIPAASDTAPVMVAAQPHDLPAARLTVDAGHVLHAASPYVIGFNRNHNQRQFDKYGMDRQALLDAMKALSPRWGATYIADLREAGYPADPLRPMLYRTGHGPTDGRTDWRTLTGYFFDQCWDQDGQADNWDGYCYDDLRYALGEADAMGADTLVTVNFGSDTPENAGKLAGYLNRPEDPLRATHPFGASPYRLASEGARGAFMFEVGNEIALRVAMGHDKANSIDEYVDHAADYVAEIRRASPHPVKVALDAAVNVYWGGPNNSQVDDAWFQRADMIKGFVAAAKEHAVTFDALQYHGYPLYPVREKLAGAAYAEHLFETTLMPALAEAPFPFEVWNDEFHAASDPQRNTGLYGALYAADSTVTAFRLSARGRQLMPVLTDFAMWHAGPRNGGDSLYFQNDDPRSTTPVYAFRRLLASHFGDRVVEAGVSGIGAWRDVASNGEVTEVSNLHATASLSADGRTMYLLVVNRSPDQGERVALDLRGFQPAAGASGRLARIASDGAAAAPWEAAWNQVSVTEDVPFEPAAAIDFPAGTISLLELR